LTYCLWFDFKIKSRPKRTPCFLTAPELVRRSVMSRYKASVSRQQPTLKQSLKCVSDFEILQDVSSDDSWSPGCQMSSFSDLPSPRCRPDRDWKPVRLHSPVHVRSDPESFSRETLSALVNATLLAVYFLSGWPHRSDEGRMSSSGLEWLEFGIGLSNNPWSLPLWRMSLVRLVQPVREGKVDTASWTIECFRQDVYGGGNGVAQFRKVLYECNLVTLQCKSLKIWALL
jgi:hypothetical protein